MAPAVDISQTFGAAYVGAMITMSLYGLTTLQTYFYYLLYPKDRSGLKSLVALIWLLDTAHSVLVCQAMYYYLVTNYANPEALAVGTRSLYTSVLVNLTTSAIVQSFFTKRIFTLCPRAVRWWLCAPIALIVLCHVVFGLVTVIEFFIKKRLDRLPELTLYGATPFAVFAVLSDVVIAASLCVLLHSHRTTFRSTNALVNTLIVYAINRCLLTSVVAVAEVLVFAILPKSFWFLAIDFVIGKLYANSFLATLNTRHALRGRGLADTRRSSGPGPGHANGNGSSAARDGTGPGFDVQHPASMHWAGAGASGDGHESGFGYGYADADGYGYGTTTDPTTASSVGLGSRHAPGEGKKGVVAIVKDEEDATAGEERPKEIIPLAP